MRLLSKSCNVKPDRVPSAPKVVEVLLTLTQAIRRRHNARLSSYDSSVPRARLLRAIVELGTPRMSDLAAHLGLTARTITTAVDALERGRPTSASTGTWRSSSNAGRAHAGWTGPYRGVAGIPAPAQ
jgi:hypothetical protein